METSLNPVIDPDDSLERDAVKRIWTVAVAVGLLSAVPIAIFKDRFPWLIAVPIGLGVLVAIGWELRLDWKWDAARKRGGSIYGVVADIPGNFAGLHRYRRVELQVRDTTENRQQEMFAFIEVAAEPPRKPRRVKLEDGQEICLVSAQRFIELLVSRLLAESDDVVEKSIAVGARRFGGTGKIAQNLLEVMQADFRGNWITVVTRGAEQVLREVEKQLKSTEGDPETFQLDPVETSAKKRSRKKPRRA